MPCLTSIKKNTEALLSASKEVVEVSTERTKYIFMFCHQTTGQNYNTEVANRTTALENVAVFRHLETTIRYQHYSHKEIKSRLNSENASCHAVQHLLSSHVLSKNINTTFRTLILLLFCTGLSW
jgi:hypothetical protein